MYVCFQCILISSLSTDTCLSSSDVSCNLQHSRLAGCKSAVLCVYIMLYVSKHLCSSTLRVLSLAVSFGYFVKSAFWLVVITGHSTSICLCKIFMLLSLICLFLSRVSMLTRDIDIANRSVRPSVCPFVRYVPISDENGITYRHSFFIIR